LVNLPELESLLHEPVSPFRQFCKKVLHSEIFILFEKKPGFLLQSTKLPGGPFGCDLIGVFDCFLQGHAFAT